MLVTIANAVATARAALERGDLATVRLELERIEGAAAPGRLEHYQRLRDEAAALTLDTPIARLRPSRPW